MKKKGKETMDKESVLKTYSSFDLNKQKRLLPTYNYIKKIYEMDDDPKYDVIFQSDNIYLNGYPVSDEFKRYHYKYPEEILAGIDSFTYFTELDPTDEQYKTLRGMIAYSNIVYNESVGYSVKYYEKGVDADMLSNFDNYLDHRFDCVDELMNYKQFHTNRDKASFQVAFLDGIRDFKESIEFLESCEVDPKEALCHIRFYQRTQATNNPTWLYLTPHKLISRGDGMAILLPIVGFVPFSTRANTGKIPRGSSSFMNTALLYYHKHGYMRLYVEQFGRIKPEFKNNPEFIKKWNEVGRGAK